MKGSVFMDLDVYTDICGSDLPACVFPSSVDKDLYLPTGCYISVIGNTVLFDSGCSMAVSPYKSDFLVGIKYIKKRETGSLFY